MPAYIPEENSNEDVHAIVLEIAGQTGADIKAVDIDKAHHVGKPKNIEINDKNDIDDRN